MKNTINFARLDFITLKSYWWSLLAFPAMWVGISLYWRNVSWLENGMLMVLVSVMVQPFIISDKNGMDALYATLPLTRSDIVRGRFLFTLISELSAFLLIFALAKLLTVALAIETTTEEIIFSSLRISITFSTLAAVSLPFLFETGYVKTKLFIIPAVMIGLMVMIFLNAFPETPNGSILAATLSAHPGLACALTAVACMTLLGVSYKVSCRLYSQRDF